jgi:Lrp/AsnC family leucine-responsive transcriptional regulator
MPQLDAIDIRLINELQRDAKQSIKQLAEKVNLSITPVQQRIKKIEQSKLIKGYVGIINPLLVDKKLTVYCQVTLVKHQEAYFKDFEQFINSHDEIMEMSYITGKHDFLLKILLRDMLEYQEFVLHKMAQLKIVSNIQSSFVIKQVKNETKIKLSLNSLTK